MVIVADAPTRRGAGRTVLVVLMCVGAVFAGSAFGVLAGSAWGWWHGSVALPASDTVRAWVVDASPDGAVTGVHRDGALFVDAAGGGRAGDLLLGMSRPQPGMVRVGLVRHSDVPTMFAGVRERLAAAGWRVPAQDEDLGDPGDQYLAEGSLYGAEQYAFRDGLVMSWTVRASATDAGDHATGYVSDVLVRVWRQQPAAVRGSSLVGAGLGAVVGLGLFLVGVRRARRVESGRLSTVLGVGLFGLYSQSFVTVPAVLTALTYLGSPLGSVTDRPPFLVILGTSRWFVVLGVLLLVFAVSMMWRRDAPAVDVPAAVQGPPVDPNDR